MAAGIRARRNRAPDTAAECPENPREAEALQSANDPPVSRADRQSSLRRASLQTGSPAAHPERPVPCGLLRERARAPVSKGPAPREYFADRRAAIDRVPLRAERRMPRA